uniref:Uncharacterized protein n=1 Tax=Pygocentrus nattereri TaxID=42514 RepID=A0A3B4CVH6_PYGNA
MIDIGQISALSTQQVKTSVNVQATETTLGPTVLKVSQVGTETALAAPASVQTTDAPVHETVDKTPEVKTESPRPADKEEKRVSEEQRQARSFQFANKPIQNEEVVVQVESNPTTPCELDSTVLSVLGDETRTLKVNKEGQDIFSVSPESYSSAEEELKEIHRASESSLRKTASELVYIKDPVSIKQHPTCVENSSESEPSPHLQRGRKLSAASSSSEDFKLDSPDSGDEEFIRRQLMQMSADESLSPKDEETYIRKEIREKEQQMQHEAREAERETTETKPKQIPKKSSVELEESVDNSLISQKQDVQSMHDIPISETIEESVTVVVLNDNEKDRIADNDSAIVISAQQSISIRQITEEESLIEDSEDRSKGDGSSSIQASSITPGTASPTSASSFDEESDSSPSHKKAGAEGKQQMKVKHRQGQALPTIDDSSEGEEIQDKGYQLLQHEQQSESEQHLKMTSQKSKKDELHEQRRLDHPPSNLSSVEVVTQAEDEWQLSEVKIHELYSFSNISPSIESEPENAYTHLLPEEKPLKSAEETYEEMMEKAQALKAMTKNVTPPEIEPLYGGMLIEDYAYESLVEEPAQAAAVESSFTDNQYLSKVIVQETVRKLRTPEEAYEEMQKKRELILEGQTVQHEHVDKAAAQTDPFGPAATDTCYVTMSAYDERSIGKEVESQLNAKPANEEVLKKQKEVLTPGTSPTQSSPLSPVSPISLSEPSYDSPEVILIPSSGEEDNIKDEYAIEPTECAMQPYISESPSEDLSVKKVLYPIPDLKITQCSSGEDEAGDEDSSTQEHEIAVSTDTTQVIYSSVKTEPSAQTQSVEMEPISVLCEVPQTKPVLENVSFWDSTPSPLSPQTSSPDSATSSLRDQTPESGFIPETPTVIESSRAVVPDSAPVTITMPDSVSEPAPQISEVKVHPDAVSFQERASLPQVTTVATAPSPPEVSKLPLAPKPTIVSAVADISVSQQPPIAKQTSAPKTAEVSDTKPPLASKQSPAPMLAEVPVSKPPLAPKSTPKTLPTSEAIIVKIPDGVASPVLDSVLQTVVSNSVLELSPTLPTSSTDSLHEQIPISVSIQTSVDAAGSTVLDSSRASVSSAQVPIPYVIPAPVVHMSDMSSASEHPASVPFLESISSAGSTADHSSRALVQVSPAASVTVLMPDLVTSPSQSPVHTANVVAPPPVPTTSSVEQVSVSVPTSISVSIPTYPTTTAQQISVLSHISVPISSASMEHASICPPISEKTGLITHHEPSVPLSSVPHAIPATDRKIMPPDTDSAQISIFSQNVDSSLVATTTIPALPIAGQTRIHADYIATKEIPVITSALTTAAAFTDLPSQPTQSVVLDIQSRIGNIQPTVDASDRSATMQTRQGHFVIILPNFENMSVMNQTTQDIVNNAMAAANSIEEGRSHPVVVSVPPVISTDAAQFVSSMGWTAGLATQSTFVSTKPEPQVTSVSHERTERPIIEFPPPPAASPPDLPPDTLPNPVSQHSFPILSSVRAAPSESLTSMTSTAPSAVVKQTVAPVHKPPPPVPPKPICVPAGLVFSHRSRESVKPPVVPEPTVAQTGRAATLPRTREPPNALSLSLTAPVDSKHSISSPKSPLSPRFAKTLETYVVITLPSEPGSPVEGITTQAPIRRSSLPTPKQQAPAVAPRVFSPPAVSAPLTVVPAPVVAAPPKVISAPVMIPPPVIVPAQTVHVSPVIAVPPETAPIVSVSKAVEPALASVLQPWTVGPPVLKEMMMTAVQPVTTTVYTAPIVISAPTVTSPYAFFEAPNVAEVPAVTTEPTINTLSTVISAPTVYATPPIAAPLAMVSESVVPTSLLTEATIAVKPAAFTGSPTPTHAMEPMVSVDVMQEPERQSMQTVCSAPITITQLPLSTNSQTVQGLEMEEVLIVSASEEAISAISPSPVAVTQIQQHQTIFEPQQEDPAVYTATVMPTAPVTYTQFTKSVESQEIRGPDKVVSSMSQVYSAISKTEQHPDTIPNIVTQVVTTEVQRTTTVSVVQERIPVEPVPDHASMTVIVQPEMTKTQTKPIQNGKMHYPGDVIDLTTLKVNVTMTDKGMDLTAPEASRQSFSSDSSGRQTTAVQPEIVNLSAEITPATTLSVVTDNITIVTCTATITYKDNIADKPLNLGSATSMPLSLTTYKPFEPLAQIVYRPVNSQPKPTTSTEIPVNLSCGATETTADSLPVAPVTCTKAGVPIHTEPSAVEAIDLTTSKPMKAMVALSSSSGIVTTVVEDDAAPVDLTAGRRTVCCDVLYRLPFTGSCRTQPPVTTQPDNQLGFKDDHYQYDNATSLGIKDLSKMVVSMSEVETGLFPYENKNGYGYQNGASDGAIDLTSAKMSTDEALDYSKKGTLSFSTTQGTSFGLNSVLRSSNGVVYSSVSAPIPSTYAITTQPGSIFSTTYNSLSSITEPFSTLQNQPSPYDFIHTTGTNQSIFLDSDPSKDILPSALANFLPSLTAFPELYSDATLEAIAASLDALVSPNFPALDDSKSQQYQAEREFLQLEKLKQLCLAEELEWERQEIQRYREQEQLIVQKELEELQSMKHQLLMQQEEERKAHFILQQETFAQQQLQLEQIHHLQQQLQQQLEEQKIYPYGFEPNEEMSQPTGSGIILDAQYSKTDNGQYWPVKDDNSTSSAITIHDPLTGGDWYTAGSSTLSKLEGVLKDSENSKKLPSTSKEANEESVGLSGKKIAESGVQTDEEDEVEKPYPGRRRRNRRSVDSCVQTDDEDQDEWDVPVRSRRRSRSSRYADGERGKGSKVSSIAVQTVAEISVQTDHSGTIKRSPVRAQIDTTVDLHRGGQTESDSDVTSDKDKRHSTPIEIGVSTHLKADGVGISSVPKSPKVLYSPVSPVSPAKGSQKMLTAEPSRHPSSPRSLKASQRSLSDPKSLSPTTDDRVMYQYSKSSQSGTTVGSQKKVKRTLPHPPPEEDTIVGPSGYSTGSARRRMCRNTTMARAKILQDIDKELDLVERESSKLRKKQAELDEEEKEIDAKLRYLEMGINRRKEALLKEREKRERAYLQGVAEERDYMSDSEVSNIREARGNGHGLERPRTAPQSEFNQFIPPQTEADSQYAQLGSPYSHYQYASQTGTPSHFSQQNLYQQQSLYHQQVSPYQTQSMYSSVPTLNQQSQQAGYDHASQLLLMQQKSRQTTLSDLEPKITTNYEVIRNQPLLIVPTSTESAYGVSHLGGKYGNLDLRLGLEERGSMASSPMSSISAESFYADIDHHNARNYVMIDDIGELTKGSTGLSSSFSIPDKDMSKTDRLLRAAEVRRTSDVTDFLGPLQAASRLHSYGKPDEDSMEEPYELKLLKQQIKQEFRRGTDGLEQLTGLPHYLHADSFRHFPKSEKYSIGRLTLEKQAAKQLPASVLYQKQLKNKRALIDPKITKFSPIQESRDLEPDYSGFLASTGSAVGGLSSRARLLQDEITFGLRKNIAEQQKYLGSTLSTNLTQSLTLGQSLNLGPTLRSSLQDDGTYPSGTRSRPSSRPSSVYGLDLSIKRDLSSSSLRLKTEGESIDSQFGMARAKPTSLPISQSRGRIPIVAQNSEEESPLSPVGQPMGMARASAGPLPPISADSRDQFGSSHSLPEVQQHMREESRTRGYDRDIAFIMDDLQGAMSDSEAYHLQHEETDWFDKPREGRGGPHSGQDRRQVRAELSPTVKAIHYPFPHTRIKLQRDPKDHTVSGSGMGIRVVGGKEIPGSNGEIGAYIAKVSAGGSAERTGKVVEGMQVLEWNGIPLMGKTYEEVQSIMGQQHSGDVEICVRLDLNMLSDSEHPQQLELQSQLKAGKRSPGVDPKQLAAELQKVSQQQAPVSVLAALEKAGHLHSATASAASSAVPSPGQPGSPSVNKKRHSSKSAEALKPQPHPITGEIQLQINYDKNMGNLIVHVLQARNLAPRDNNGYSDPFVKVYLLPGRSQVMVVQNASAENKRRTKYVQKTQNPEWNQTVIYKNIHLEQLKRKTLEVTVWDYDRYSTNDFLGEVLIDLSNTAQLDNMPRWHPLKEQSESIHHSRGHPPQGGSEQSPKTSVIKSRSHGIFPDPAKDTQVPTIEKSHSSPGSSKSSSEGHLRSHGPSRSQSKSSVTQAHLEDAGNAIAAAEAAVQQARLQPSNLYFYT